ncbi:rod-binding protein [Campylobacter sp. RM16187]|uniref:rod-binding protein n=1 Tax=Campylobacter sp. RM16187 TaxID=1660063 RepID=UPI0021B4F150|nr:rod-binding protein [Campylobacter sp. RM16187]QKG29445.1 putative flagellar protein FlgJ [Campylobacter sp. RM16187]
MNIDNQLAISAYNNMATNSIINRSKSENDRLLKEQTDAFEAFLVKSVLDIALKDENPLFPKDAGDKIYSSMYNDTMSRALSGNLGFSELLFNFLKERA